LGHGPVPPDTIQQFSTVIWVGNNYNGDYDKWTDTPVYSYLTAGGNLLLMTRRGQDFVNDAFGNYLGITWREAAYNTINNCVSTHPGMVSMTRTGTQSYCAVFDTSLTTSESTLLLKETSSFSIHRGLGVWREPAAGGTHRSDGAQFVFLSGRPYRWDHDQLRANVEYILSGLFEEPYDPTGITTRDTGPKFVVEQNYPNPFNPVTTIRFAVPEKGLVTLRVYDVSGRLVRTVISKDMPAGNHKVEWNGKNNGGESVASGVYFYRVSAGRHTATRKMVLLR
jgi:hypothetical protein